MSWRTPFSACRQSSRALSTGVGLQKKVPQTAPKMSVAARKVIDEKINELMDQLAEEDAYYGPITAQQQNSGVKFGDASHIRPDLDRSRVVPAVMSFYMANPALEEAIRSLRTLTEKYTDSPTIPEEEYEAPRWIDPTTLYSTTKAGLTEDQKSTFYGSSNRLARIEPPLQSSALQKLLYEMQDKSGVANASRVAGQPAVVTAISKRSLDSLGRSVTGGGRKTANATVYMARAQPDVAGQISVNGRSIEQYFPSIIERTEVLYPLKVVNAFAKFNISATVQGGGQTSKASAIGLAIAKGLCIQNPLLVKRSLEAGCLYRDPRKKERKKPGKAGARKSYGWVKR